MPIIMGKRYSATRVLRDHNSNVGVCILAAGLAKRLEPISGVIAKPVFPLGGRVPIAELWVRRFAEAGITNIAMNLHRVPDSVCDHFGDGKRFLADIVYVRERTPSGTLGGAIKMVRALQKKGFYPERVFIPSGDIVSGIGTQHLKRMLDAHQQAKAAVTLMMAPVPWDRLGDFGTIVLEGQSNQNVPADTYARIVDFLEKDPNSKSNENNASNYLIEVDLLMKLEPHLTPADLGISKPCYDFAKHMFMGMLGKVPYLKFLTKYLDCLYGYEPGSIWFDVGNKRDYLSVNTAVLNGEIEMALPYTRYPWGWMGAQVKVDLASTTIRPPVVIGSDCTLMPKSEIGPNVVLGDGWLIHKRAKISNAVLWPRLGGAKSNFDPDSIMADIREVREGVIIDNAVIVGGVIDCDIKDQTVDVGHGSKLDIRSIDWVPKGPRA